MVLLVAVLAVLVLAVLAVLAVAVTAGRGWGRPGSGWGLLLERGW